jgi:ClpP class serine protease
LNEFYERFLAKVGDGRGLERDAVHAVAQGRVWTGRQGLAHGLVDAPGGLLRALDSAKWQLGLTRGDKVGVVTYGEQLSLFERMLLESLRRNASLARTAADLAGLADGADLWAAAPAPVPLLAATLREDGTFARMALMDGRPVAMAPYWVRVR